jgi:glutamine amidotransferase
MTATVTVLDYGSGNLHSVSRALAHVGADVRVVDAPADVGGDAVLIPARGRCAPRGSKTRSARLSTAARR